MTTNQIKAAGRMIAKLTKIRESLEKTNTAGCFTLQQITEQAIASNALCIAQLQERIRVETKFAGSTN
jgi:hypothetical protein